MKFTCDKTVLQDSINIVSKAVSSKSSLPILEGILLTCTDTLKLTGNDLEIGIECVVDAQISERGSVVYNAKVFGDIIRCLPDGMVDISCDENYNTRISCGYTKFEIMGLPGDEFPEIPQMEKEQYFKIEENKLRDMIRQTIFAIGTNENKFILTGSLFEIDNDKLSIVSVDGYRLAIRREAIEDTNQNDSFVIPGKTLSDLLKLLGDSKEKITVFYGEQHVLFEIDNFVLVSRLLEGEFLNYEQIIPKENAVLVKTKVQPLIRAFERVGLMISAGDTNKSPAILTMQNDTIDIFCQSSVGKIDDHLNAEIKGNKLTIGFNHRYFLDALKACEGEEVLMEFNTHLSPCVIKPMEGNAYLYIVLPVRLRNE